MMEGRRRKKKGSRKAKSRFEMGSGRIGTVVAIEAG